MPELSAIDCQPDKTLQTHTSIDESLTAVDRHRQTLKLRGRASRASARRFTQYIPVRKQSRRAFASTNPDAGAQDATIQIGATCPAIFEHSLCNSKSV